MTFCAPRLLTWSKIRWTTRCSARIARPSNPRAARFGHPEAGIVRKVRRGQDPHAQARRAARIKNDTLVL